MAELANQNEALNALVSGIKVAVKRGAFEIEEIEILLKAIRLFIPQPQEAKAVDAPQVETLVQ